MASDPADVKWNYSSAENWELYEGDTPARYAFSEEHYCQFTDKERSMLDPWIQSIAQNEGRLGEISDYGARANGNMARIQRG
jgi:hypothetical protein